MDWLKSQWSSWKVKVSVVGGALVIATAYGTCEVDPNAVSTDTTETATETATETTTETSTETVEVSATTATGTTTTGTETTGTDGGTTTEGAGTTETTTE